MLASLEVALCRLHQRSYCVPVSSGTVGLALTMAALGLEGKGIAIPAGVCLNVPLAAQYAGANSVYCDIDPETLGLSPSILRDAAGPFAAVLAVHAYGNLCAIGAIEDYCRSANLLLIEDVAVAQGATADGRPAGSFGTASILSFGKGKIIDVGGGGAVLTNDRALAEAVRRRYGHLPPRTHTDDQRINSFSSWHTQLYNLHYGKDLDLHIASFVHAALSLREATLTGCRWDADGVERDIRSLGENLARRRGLVARLCDMVEERLSAVHCHRPAGEFVPWRANLFVEGNRNQVLRALLADRMRISSWYPPAQDFLAPAWIGDTPVARRVGEQILNVWVNSEVDAGYPAMVVERIAALTSDETRLSAS